MQRESKRRSHYGNTMGKFCNGFCLFESRSWSYIDKELSVSVTNDWLVSA